MNEMHTNIIHREAGLMTFYGSNWPPHLEPRPETPAQGACMHCAEAIAAGEDSMRYSGHISRDAAGDPVLGPGLPAHRECFLRQVYGSVGHQTGTCACNGTANPIMEDPENMTPREAARAAVEMYEAGHGLAAKQLAQMRRVN